MFAEVGVERNAQAQKIEIVQAFYKFDSVSLPASKPVAVEKHLLPLALDEESKILQPDLRRHTKTPSSPEMLDQCSCTVVPCDLSSAERRSGV